MITDGLDQSLTSFLTIMFLQVPYRTMMRRTRHLSVISLPGKGSTHVFARNGWHRPRIKKE